MKFKKPIEVQAGISDGDPTNPLGVAGYLLSSDGSNVSWVSPGGLSAETAEAVVQPIKANEALTKGDPLYIVGYQTGQDVNIVAKADSSIPSKMPAVGIADADYSNQAFGTMTAFGSFNGNFDTTGGTENWSIGDIIFVKSGGGLTNVKPGGTKLIQNIAIVSRVQQNTGELEVIALGRTNDVPNLPTGRLFVGTSDNTSLTSDVVYIDDTNDRVGIGTNNPATKLQVNGSVLSTLGLYSDFNFASNRNWSIETNAFGTGNWGGIAIKTSTNAGLDPSATRFGIDSSGNVGIGTSIPSTVLEVSSSGVNGIDISKSASNASQSGRLFFTTNTTSEGFLFYNNNGKLQINSGGIPNDTSGSERVTIVGSTGFVGIGTNIPNSKLQVEGEIDANGGDGYRINGKPWAAESSNNLRLGDWDGEGFSTTIYDDNSAPIVDVTQGNVGIGIGIPTQKLHVQGNARLTGLFYDGSNSGGATGQILSSDGSKTGWIDGSAIPGVPAGSGTTNYLARWTPDASTLGTGVTYDDGVRVGIGTNNPSQNTKLDVYGNLRLGTTGKLSISQSPYISTSFYVNTQSGGLVTFGAPASVQQNVAVQGNLYTYAGSTSGYLGTTVTGSFSNRLQPTGDNYLNSGSLGIGTTNPITQLTLGTGSTGISFQSALTTFNSGKIAVIKPIELGNGNGELVFETYKGGSGGGERMRIDNDGNVGIGTDNPSAKLHVFGTTASVPSLGAAASAAQIGGSSYGTLFSTLTSGTGVIQQGRSDGNSPYTFPLLINPNGGNVGIGTTSLNSISATSAMLSLGSTSTVTSGGIAFQINGAVKAYNYVTSDYLINQTVSGIGQVFYGAGSERMRIHKTTGNVGIGTTNPQEKLHVQNYTTGESHQAMFKGGAVDVGDYSYISLNNGYISDYNKEVRLAAVSESNFGNKTGFAILTSPDSSGASGHERLRVTSDGDVGIGTTNPNAKLEIAGHSTSGKFLLIDNVAATETFLDVEDGAGSTLLSITRETGNTIKFNSYNDFSFADNISVTGTVTATNFILSSDKTLKDNIKEIDVKHTDVNWKNFELKSEPGIKRAGVIAQELEVKHPEFVRTASDGIKSVAYIDLLITKIAELEARLEKAGL